MALTLLFELEFEHDGERYTVPVYAPEDREVLWARLRDVDRTRARRALDRLEAEKRAAAEGEPVDEGSYHLDRCVSEAFLDARRLEEGRRWHA